MVCWPSSLGFYILDSNDKTELDTYLSRSPSVTAHASRTIIWQARRRL